METNREVLIQLQRALAEQYSAQLAASQVKKATREVLIAGFQDGARAGIHHAVKMLGVTIID